MWIEIYHTKTDEPTDLRQAFIVVAVISYLVVAALVVADSVKFPESSWITLHVPKTPVQQGLFGFAAVGYLAVSLLFLFYGIRVYMKFKATLLHRVSAATKMSAQVLPRIMVLTVLSACIWTTRSILALWVVIKPWDDAYTWWIDLLNYTLLEVVPLSLMMAVFRQPTTNIATSPSPARDASSNSDGVADSNS